MNRTRKRSTFVTITLLCIGMILLTQLLYSIFEIDSVRDDNHQLNNDNIILDKTDVRTYHFNDEQATNNTKLIHQKRHVYHDLCENSSSSHDDILQYLHDFYHPITNESSEPLINDGNKQHEEKKIYYNFSNNVIPCKYVFLDVGTQSGNSLSKFIEAGMEACPKKFITQPHYHLKTHSIVDHYDRGGDDLTEYDIEDQIEKDSLIKSRLSLWLRKVMTEHSNQVNKQMDEDMLQPEDYCYYGIEGNPYYTKTLYELEKHMMIDSSDIMPKSPSSPPPRPIRLVHFFTETVMTNITGPMKLYVHTNDTHDPNHHSHNNLYKNHQFYSSTTNHATASIVTTKGQHQQEKQQDTTVEVSEEDFDQAVLDKVTSSSNHHNDGSSSVTDLHELDIQSVSLTSLLPQIVKLRHGSHVIIKFDIEGGEYVVLNEAYHTNNLLCDMSLKKAIRIDILIEIHKNVQLDDEEGYDHYKKGGVHDQLKRCRVRVYIGREGGYRRLI